MDSFDWTEANRRLAEYDRRGEFVPAEEAMADFVAAVRVRAAERSGEDRA